MHYLVPFLHLPSEVDNNIAISLRRNLILRDALPRTIWLIRGPASLPDSMALTHQMIVFTELICY